MKLGIDSFPDVRYDYMLQLDEYVTNGFYKPYVKKCHELGRMVTRSMPRSTKQMS
jgi:hypothetical protein